MFAAGWKRVIVGIVNRMVDNSDLWILDIQWFASPKIAELLGQGIRVGRHSFPQH